MYLSKEDSEQGNQLNFETKSCDIDCTGRCKELVKKCTTHRLPLDLYCLRCTSKICHDCALDRHRKCNVQPLKLYVRKLWDAALENDKVEVRELRGTISKIKWVFQSKLDHVRQMVNDVTNQLIREIDARRNHLMNQLEDIKMWKGNLWDQQIDLCDTALRKLKSEKRRIHDFRDINFIRKTLFTTLASGLDFIEDEFVEFVTDMKPGLNLGQVVTSPSPSKTIVTLPDVSFVRKFNTCRVSVRNIVDEAVTDIRYTMSATFEDEGENLVYLTIENFKDGNYNIMYYPTASGKHLMYIYINGAPVKGSPFEITVSRLENPNDYTVLTVGGPEELLFLRPWGIATDGEEKIFVVDRGHNCIKVFKPDGSLTLSFGSEGSGPGQFVRPAGVAVDRILRRVIVADKDNHRIQLFNCEGRYLSQFGSHGDGNGFFSYPWDVAVSRTSVILVSDSKNCRIQMFDHKGCFLRKYCFRSPKVLKELDLPRGVAFKSDGSILVTDFNKHQVIWISPDFETVKKLGSEGADVTQFYRPQGIDVDEHGRFAVADCKNHRIQVFTPDGKIYKVISSPGRIDSPQGLCFLPNGRLVVAELYNNRIQIIDLNLA